MQGSITFTELGMLILFLLGIGVGVYVILTLKNINAATKEMSDLLKQHRKDVEVLSKSVPHIHETTQNAAEISREVKSRVYEAGRAIGVISQDTTDTMLRVNETADQVATYVMVFGEIAKAALGVFTDGKRS